MNNRSRESENDLDYVPVVEEESITVSSGESFPTEESSYDPLANLEEYMRMRDQL